MIRIFTNKSKVPEKAKCIISLWIDNIRFNWFFGLYFVRGENG